MAVQVVACGFEEYEAKRMSSAIKRFPAPRADLMDSVGSVFEGKQTMKWRGFARRRKVMSDCSRLLVGLLWCVGAIQFSGIEAFADQPVFLKEVKASLFFREESNPSAPYPHLLRVYLCLENRHDSEVNWMCNSVMNVEAELLDAKGVPVPQPSMAASVLSNPKCYLLPYGSRLDWMLSHGGVSMFHMPKKKDPREESALIIGTRGWLIPRDSLNSYSLKVCVKGWPWRRHDAVDNLGRPVVLFEVPATPIVIKTADPELR